MKRSPPDARIVARRAIALHFVTLLAVNSHDASMIRRWRRRMTAAQWRAMRASSRLIHRSYMADCRRWKCQFSPREQAFMAHDSLDFPEREHIEMSWHSESLRVLAWALRFSARLPRSHVAALDQNLHGFLGNDAGAFLRQARLRSRRELEYERERSAARLRRDRGRQAAELPFRWDVIGVARLGREYYGKEWSPAVAIARERLHALNWLCGYAPGNSWDEVPADASTGPGSANRLPPRRTPARGPMIKPARGRRRRIAVRGDDIDGR